MQSPGISPNWRRGFDKLALPQIKWVDYRCRAEFIRPTAYDALRRGRHSLRHQVYCITTVTRGRRPLFTDITAARLLG